MLDQINPRIPVQGNRPWTGVFLTVKWHYFYAIIGVILGLQLIAGGLTISSTRNVYCPEDKNLVIARLLRSVVERAEDRGTAATAEQLYAIFKQDLLQYGVVAGVDGQERLGILSKKVDGKLMGRPMVPDQYFA